MTARVIDIPMLGAPAKIDLSERSGRPQGMGQGYRLGSTEDPWNRNWNPLPSLPDTELTRHMAYMWGRSYDLHRNNGYVAGPTTRLAAMVGELVPQFLTSDPEERAILESLWDEWSPQAMSDGVGSWAMFDEMLVGNAGQGGDVLVTLEERSELDGPIPLRVNLIDAWRVANPEQTDTDGRKISLGVKKDKGVELGYFVSREDGEKPYYFPRLKNGRPNAVLFRRPDPLRRPGQSRGTPIATPYLNAIKDAWDHERHHARTAGSRARQKAVVQAADVAEIKRLMQNIKQAKDEKDTTLEMLLRQSLKATVVETPEASTLILPSWAKYQSTPTDTVDANFTAYMKGQKQSVAPGWGMGREMAYLEMEDANFARARIHFMQAQSEVKRWIRDISTQVGRPLIKLFVQYAWAYGYLKKDPTPETYKVSWHGLPVEYMDLGGEVNAYADAKASGVMSPQAIARRSNTSWELTLREELEYAKRYKEIATELELSNEDISAALGNRSDAPTTSPKEPLP